MTTGTDPSALDTDKGNGDDRNNAGPISLSRVTAAVGYLPMLFFVPLIACRRDAHASAHGRQSLAMLLALVAAWFVVWLCSLMLGRVLGDIVLLGFLFRALGWFLHNVVGGILSVAYIIGMLVGSVRALSGLEWELPYIGRYSRRYLCP